MAVLAGEGDEGPERVWLQALCFNHCCNRSAVNLNVKFYQAYSTRVMHVNAQPDRALLIAVKALEEIQSNVLS